MGAVEEIHERERALIKRLAGRILNHLHDREGAVEIDPPDEIEWGLVLFHVQAHNANIAISLQVEP